MSTSEFAGREALTNTAQEIPNVNTPAVWPKCNGGLRHQGTAPAPVDVSDYGRSGWYRCGLGSAFAALGFCALDSATFGRRSVHLPIAYEECTPP